MVKLLTNHGADVNHIERVSRTRNTLNTLTTHSQHTHNTLTIHSLTHNTLTTYTHKNQSLFCKNVEPNLHSTLHRVKQQCTLFSQKLPHEFLQITCFSRYPDTYRICIAGITLFEKYFSGYYKILQNLPGFEIEKNKNFSVFWTVKSR